MIPAEEGIFLAVGKDIQDGEVAFHTGQDVGQDMETDDLKGHTVVGDQAKKIGLINMKI